MLAIPPQCDFINALRAVSANSASNALLGLQKPASHLLHKQNRVSGPWDFPAWEWRHEGKL